MPNVYTATTVSIETRAGELGQPRTITVIRHVRRNDGAFINMDTEIAAMQAEGHVPYMNAAYAPTPPTGMTWERYALCRDINYRTDNASRVITFTLMFSTLWMEDRGAETLTYVLPSSTEYVARTRATNIYRTGWSVQPSNTNASADIGGTAVSNGTQPVSIQVAQVQMRVRLTLDASVNDMLYATTGLSTYINKINTAAFAGCAAGTLICEGVSAAKTSAGYEFYEVIFEFLFDPFFHLEQVCDTDEKGYPRIASNVPSVVKWKRPARTGIDFNNIFNADTGWQRRTLEGWWV
jgi:hypothetical protein